MTEKYSFSRIYFNYYRVFTTTRNTSVQNNMQLFQNTVDIKIFSAEVLKFYVT